MIRAACKFEKEVFCGASVREGPLGAPEAMQSQGLSSVARAQPRFHFQGSEREAL